MKSVHARLDAARHAFDNGDYRTALAEFLPLAQEGDAQAQYFVGRMFHEGRGAPEDNKVAFGWAHKAAAHGLADAEALLGTLYAQGQGVTRDDDEAARWFHKAAAGGNPIGLTKMGMCCMRGLGVPKDHQKAWMYFDLAASRTTGHDHKCNCHARDTLAGMHLTPAQIEEAQRMARAWKPREPSLLKRLVA